MPFDDTQPSEPSFHQEPSSASANVPSSCSTCEEYLLGWKRALADYDNIKKNLVKEKGELRRAVKEEFILSLLPVVDNFDQAIRHKPKDVSAEVENWLVGILHVQNQLNDVLKELGAESFGRAGDPFDAQNHETVGSHFDKEKSEDAIIEIQQRGWKMGEKLIRPAKVIVNRAPNA